MEDQYDVVGEQVALEIDEWMRNVDEQHCRIWSELHPGPWKRMPRDKVAGFVIVALLIWVLHEYAIGAW